MSVCKRTGHYSYSYRDASLCKPSIFINAPELSIRYVCCHNPWMIYVLPLRLLHFYLPRCVNLVTGWQNDRWTAAQTALEDDYRTNTISLVIPINAQTPAGSSSNLLSGIYKSLLPGLFCCYLKHIRTTTTLQKKKAIREEEKIKIDSFQFGFYNPFHLSFSSYGRLSHAHLLPEDVCNSKSHTPTGNSLHDLQAAGV